MIIRIITLRFLTEDQAFDVTPLNEALKGAYVSSFTHHYFETHRIPYLVCIVVLEVACDGAQVTAALPSFHEVKKGPPAEKKRRDHREGLDAIQLATWERLRAWRRDQAERDGVPPYVILTDRELRETILTRPTTTTALSAIAGFGEGKVKRYGATLLRLLNPTPTDPGMTEERPS